MIDNLDIVRGNTEPSSEGNLLAGVTTGPEPRNTGNKWTAAYGDVAVTPGTLPLETTRVMRQSEPYGDIGSQGESAWSPLEFDGSNKPGEVRRWCGEHHRPRGSCGSIPLESGERGLQRRVHLHDLHPNCPQSDEDAGVAVDQHSDQHGRRGGHLGGHRFGPGLRDVVRTRQQGGLELKSSRENPVNSVEPHTMDQLGCMGNTEPSLGGNARVGVTTGPEPHPAKPAGNKWTATNREIVATPGFPFGKVIQSDPYGNVRCQDESSWPTQESV